MTCPEGPLTVLVLLDHAAACSAADASEALVLSIQCLQIRFRFTFSCWFILGSHAKSLTRGGTLKQAPYCKMRSDMWFDHFNKGLVECRSAQGDRAMGGGPQG